jgi:dTDP-4-amino-4,6-dideoxygalactose transaminase
VSHRYPFIRPELPEPERWLPYLQPAYDQRRFANGGPAATLLERRIAADYGAGREAVLVSSGTAGLLGALLALELRGSRVALPSFTFAASAHAVRLAGCEPVFCEVSPLTWELEPDALARLDVDAVLHVRPFGLHRDLGAIEDVCAEKRIPLVVDSAAALGSAAGDAGTAEVFSLHATKSLGVGEGGVVLADAPLAARIRRAINFGFDERGSVAGDGLNGKMSELPAAVGLAVLDRAPAALAARRNAAAIWADAVGALHEPGNPAWQTFPLLLDEGRDADAFVRALGRRGLQARRYYSPALHRTPAFASAVHLPVTDALAARMVCLPIYEDATGDDTRAMARLVLDELAGVRMAA